MKIATRLTAIVLGSLLLLASGCATNRGVIRLDLPAAPAVSGGRQVLIRNVTDARKFQENPKSADIPSVGFGGAERSDTELIKRAVARKRNSFGKALGDIILAEDQNVESIIRGSLKQAYTEMGYEVVADPGQLRSGGTTLDVSIENFWAYMTMGWALTLHCNIATDMRLTDSGGEVVEKQIRVSAEDTYQTGSGRNWKETMQNAIAKYIVQAKLVLAD